MSLGTPPTTPASRGNAKASTATGSSAGRFPDRPTISAASTLASRTPATTA